uniref:Carboxylic ester hydrolase n=1 Tax=Hucho hucho TaxID=62062 RepID=A0A4W5MXQ5_9TELE
CIADMNSNLQNICLYKVFYCLCRCSSDLLTNNGVIKGLTVEKSHIFYGIPYADPPVAAYRWKPPRPVTPWPGVHEATYPRDACMQGCSGPISDECPQKVSENCLYLNIFVPLDVNFSSPLLTPLPVMVWIHGGDFIAGSASKPLYDGRFISNFTHTVVVSMEYRLGAFGFLVSGKDPKTSATGNYGILDQQVALLWVQQNIALFGGDPSKVTIFGESAGAQSVSLHLMVQSSKPLFKQAVFQNCIDLNDFSTYPQIVTDYVFLCPSRKAARAGTKVGSAVWMYVFDHVTSDHSVWSGLSFCYEHVCHGAELPFLFDTASVANFTLAPPERLLSNRMLCYWGTFAHTGDPASRVQQSGFCRQQRLPAWPRYSDTSSWLVMNFTVRSHAQVGTRDHICDFWDKLDDSIVHLVHKQWKFVFYISHSPWETCTYRAYT